MTSDTRLWTDVGIREADETTHTRQKHIEKELLRRTCIVSFRRSWKHILRLDMIISVYCDKENKPIIKYWPLKTVNSMTITRWNKTDASHNTIIRRWRVHVYAHQSLYVIVLFEREDWSADQINASAQITV